MLLVVKRSSKLAGRRRADLSPAPEKAQDTSALGNYVFALFDIAPGNSFPGARTQLSPAPGKPTHLCSHAERILPVL